MYVLFDLKLLTDSKKIVELIEYRRNISPLSLVTFEPIFVSEKLCMIHTMNSIFLVW